MEFIQRLRAKKVRTEYAQAARQAAIMLSSWEQCVDFYRRLLPPDQGE